MKINVLFIISKENFMIHNEEYELAVLQAKEQIKTSIRDYLKHGRLPKKESISKPRIPKKLKKRICARDRYLCVYCKIPLTTTNVQLDHVIPRVRGGENTTFNLVTCCDPCNKKKADTRWEDFVSQEAKEYIRKLR